MIGKELIKKQLDFALKETNLSIGTKYKGKVRDNYLLGKKRIIITTDRISAFDRVLTAIPFKGQVLNQMAAFWFEKTKHICKNHVLEVPDPNVMVVKECEALPVEAVVRAYITGVTTTSIWYNYQKGIRNFCGNPLPEGLKKNQKLKEPIFTPSTKAEKSFHDESVGKAEILKRNLLTEGQFERMKEISFKLFELGSKLVEKQGIILVDTKYEFGLLGGEFVLIDEIHTPDSSRFWFKDTYKELFEKGEEQRKIDKEYIREYLANKGFTGQGEIPEIPDEIRIEAALRYIQAFELVTGQQFKAKVGDIKQRIINNLKKGGYL